MSRQGFGLVNNIFFQKTISQDEVKIICGRKSVDIIPALLLSKAENKIGQIVLSLDPDEMEEILTNITASKNYVCLGEDACCIAGTSIEIDALIVETI